MTPEINRQSPWLAKVFFDRYEMKILRNAARFIFDSSEFCEEVDGLTLYAIKAFHNDTGQQENTYGREVIGISGSFLTTMAQAVRSIASEEKDEKQLERHYKLAADAEDLAKQLANPGGVIAADAEIDLKVAEFASQIPDQIGQDI